MSDPVVAALGGATVPTAGEAVLLAALLSLEVDDPHAAVFSFVSAATVVALDARLDVPATVSFVREVRAAYRAFLDEPLERHSEVAPAFGRHFSEALARRLPSAVDAAQVVAAVLPRYEYLMNAAAAALDGPSAPPDPSG